MPSYSRSDSPHDPSADPELVELATRGHRDHTFVHGAPAQWETMHGGVRRQILAHTTDLMLVRVDFDAGAVGQLHQHQHRQISYVAEGRFRAQVGDETRELVRGDSFLVLANKPHSVVALEAGTLLDSFTPAREDFLAVIA